MDATTEKLIEQVIESAKTLADTSMSELRILAFDGGPEQPSQKEADERFRGMTRGELIQHCLSCQYLLPE